MAVHLHPDHRSIAQELERVNVVLGIIVEPEILRARHAGDHPPLDLARRQILAAKPPLARRTLAVILFRADRARDDRAREREARKTRDQNGFDQHRHRNGIGSGH